MHVSENEIHIYKSSLLKPPEQLAEFRKLLSKDETAIANKFRFEKHREAYITGRGLLRQLLSKYILTEPSGIVFSYGDQGKPFLNNNRLKFNLAHSHERVIYAITMNTEVGIDLEYKKEMPDAVDIAERFFSKSEVEEFKTLSADDIPTGFFNCWTRKEAFIKAIGEGLSYPLAEFSVTLKPGDQPKFTWIKKDPEEINQWSLLNIDADENYISSLAVKSKNVKITMIE